MENKTAADLVAEAKKNVENLSPDQVEKEMSQGATIIDIRESEELKESGKIAGSVHAPRGMLEFLADDTTPYHKPEFDKNKRIILHCAGGGRSAMAANTLKQMGYQNVAHLDGGLKAWKEAGKPLEQ
ncbi:rhodanese-like domain-containing protein [Nibribacter koreensis]|uniref:Rhodanese-like domain-containing protein n=1 Tax=Nibribacter koreensis TaxID=1084519 RepID=A0ABP8FEA8_9BACT